MKINTTFRTLMAFFFVSSATVGCGSSTSSGGATTTDATESDIATSDTTTSDAQTSDVAKTDTTTADIQPKDGAMNGDGMGGGGDGGGGGGDICQPCMQAHCGTEFGACMADSACSAVVGGVGDCLKAAGSDSAAKQKCLDTAGAASAAAKSLVGCVSSSCAKECI